MAEPVRKRFRFGGGGFILGAVLAAAFFGVLSLPRFEGSAIRRYCCSHDVEKLTIAMFCWGLGDLLVKAMKFRRERMGLRREWIPAAEGPQPASRAEALYADVESSPASLQETWMGRRVADALLYVKEKKSADGLDEHLRYLGDTAADRSHAGFALVRIIAWMIPILGFLGTVVGITIAVANVSPNQLDSSLTEVTGGLAMAFDATAVALALAMGLMFSYFLVERTEQRLLQEVDDKSGDLLRHRFASADPASAPYLEPIRATAKTVVAHTETLVEKQAEVWGDALAELIGQSQAIHQRQEQAFGELLATLLSEGQRQEAALERSAVAMANVEGRLAETVGVLGEILQGAQVLLPLQQTLAENVAVLRQTQSLDEALHSLTAAIHLMTVRHRPGVLGEKAAA